MGMRRRGTFAGLWECVTGLIAVVCLSGAALAMQIDVTSVPKLGTTNRLANSDFEQGVSGPFNWGFSTARPDLLSAQWSEEALYGEKGVSVKATSGEMSGYWGQRGVSVEPHESLLLSAWVRMGGGRVLMYVIGYDGRVSPPKQVYNDRRLYLSAAADHPLYPVFAKAELLKGLVGPNWQRQRLFFQNSADATQANVSLGLYFFGSAPGEVWFDRAYFGVPWVELSVEVTADDQANDIQRIEVLDDGGQSVYDTGVLTVGTRSWTHKLRVAADAECYTIVVTDAKGRVIEERYPQ
jgi:hypothetical protein